MNSQTNYIDFEHILKYKYIKSFSTGVIYERQNHRQYNNYIYKDVETDYVIYYPVSMAKDNRWRRLTKKEKIQVLKYKLTH